MAFLRTRTFLLDLSNLCAYGNSSSHRKHRSYSIYAKLIFSGDHRKSLFSSFEDISDSHILLKMMIFLSKIRSLTTRSKSISIVSLRDQYTVNSQVNRTVFQFQNCYTFSVSHSYIDRKMHRKFLDRIGLLSS